MRFSAFVLLLFCAWSLGAQTETPAKKNPVTVSGAPIPKKVFAAKTALLLVNTDQQEFYYKIAYKFLADWDRWKIVTEPKDADLILKITNRDDGSIGFGSTSATTTASPAGATGIFLGVPLHHFYLSVVDRESGDRLWGTDTDERLARSANATRMLKELKKRMLETEREQRLKK